MALGVPQFNNYFLIFFILYTLELESLSKILGSFLDQCLIQSICFIFVTAGCFLDPMADKVLVGTLFVTLTYSSLIPVSLTGLIIARDLLLMAAGFYIRYLSLPPPRTVNRYFNVTLPTAQLAPTFISKVNTAVQLTLVGTTLAAPVFSYVDHPLLLGLCYLTAATTVVSGLSYVFSKNTYRIIKKAPKK
ncbi:hypothetical protein J437_LFUL009319 [Ladona fulva]|uniref:cardiolipin synthase (CMP-forming) n=1 Tax=Ladona fulva TaxID=123851 RepID=A0A8K0K6V3_LADFU|nr:hypothetical protein J437_LFUL009319 [Ladona fulva]